MNTVENVTDERLSNNLCYVMNLWCLYINIGVLIAMANQLNKPDVCIYLCN